MARYHAVNLRYKEMRHLGLIDTYFITDGNSQPEMRIIGPTAPNPKDLAGVYAELLRDEKSRSYQQQGRDSLSFSAPCDLIPFEYDNKVYVIYQVTDLPTEWREPFISELEKALCSSEE